MKRTALVCAIAAVFCATQAAKQVAAQSSIAGVTLFTDHVSQPLEILDGESAFECPNFMRPAKVDVEFDVDLYGYGNDLTLFDGNSGRRKSVVIRRGSQVISQAEERDLSSRFDKAHYSKERVAAVSDLSLHTVFYLCEVYGFPEFVRLDYSLSGHVQDYAVQFQDTLSPDNNETLYITYSEINRRVRNHETGEFETLSYGIMRADFDLGGVSFRINEDLPVLPVDLRHNLYFTIPNTDETN